MPMTKILARRSRGSGAGAILMTGLMLGGCGPSVLYHPTALKTDEAGQKEAAKLISEGATLIVLPTTRLGFDVVAEQKPEEPKPVPPAAQKPATRKPATQNTEKPAAKEEAKPEKKAEDVPPELTAKPIQTVTYNGAKWQASVIQQESGHAYLVKPNKSWFEESKLSITKYPKTDLAAVAKFNYVDKTPERIALIGSVLSAAIAILPGAVFLGAPEKTPESEPTLQPFVLTLGDDSDADWKRLPQNAPNWQYMVSYDDDHIKYRPDIVDRAAFETMIAKDASVGFFPVPACRDVTIKITNEKDKNPDGSRKVLELTGQAGTSKYLKLVPLQQDTLVALPEVCDAIVTTKEIDNIAQTLASFKAASEQYKAISEALKKRKADADKK